MAILYSVDQHDWSTGPVAVDHQSQEQMEYFFRKADDEDAYKCLIWGDCFVKQKIIVSQKLC